LVRYNLETGEKQQLTDDSRLYAPVFTGNTILALQTRPASSRLVSLTVEPGKVSSVDEILFLPNAEIIAVAQNPANDKLALIVNKQGLQALWITTLENTVTDLRQSPDISFAEGSVFDPVWHPGGKKLLFSSDFSGSHQLYEYDLENEVINQITDARF